MSHAAKAGSYLDILKHKGDKVSEGGKCQRRILLNKINLCRKNLPTEKMLAVPESKK